MNILKNTLPALIAAIVAAASPAFADVVLTAPPEAGIGQPFIAELEADGEELSDVRLHWLGHDAILAPLSKENGVQRFSAIVGSDLKNVKAGNFPLAVTFTAGGKSGEIRHSIKLTPRKYPSEKLTVDPAKLSPPKEATARIEREAKEGRAALMTNSAGGAPALPFVRPVPGSFSSVYGKSRYFNGAFRGRHGGADLRAKEGTPVKAAAAGRVVLTGDFWFAGKCIYVDNGAGLVTFYCHLSKINVKKGEMINAGEVIALSGKTGRVTGPHLHFSAAWRGEFFDPAPLLAD
ncbi:M23 family metallopeptidase [Synergistes jonesii]|uniref:M23 family metallopeptidase n=1 Tax=Synergistes jonesii TaxID=2754 RepID=UPI0024302671|nr:M23 family metallopeptidase [Synergistes jonesii]